MSAKRRRSSRAGAPARANGQMEAQPLPLASACQRTTSHLNEELLALFDGITNKTVSLSEANTKARLAAIISKNVLLECKYGPQQERRQALPLVSAA